MVCFDNNQLSQMVFPGKNGKVVNHITKFIQGVLVSWSENK